MRNRIHKLIAIMTTLIVFSLQRTIYDFVDSLCYVEEYPILGIIYTGLIYGFLVLLIWVFFKILNRFYFQKIDYPSLQKETIILYKKYIHLNSKNTTDLKPTHEQINLNYTIISNISKVLEDEKAGEYNYASYKENRIDIAYLLDIYKECKNTWEQIKLKTEASKQTELYRKVYELNERIMLIDASMSSLITKRTKKLISLFPESNDKRTE